MNKLVGTRFLPRIFVVCSIFKIFLLFLYFVSAYQDFSPQSVLLIVRFVLLNDSVLIVFSGLMIFYVPRLYGNKTLVTLLIIFAVLTLIFCLVTGFLGALIISFSAM